MQSFKLAIVTAVLGLSIGGCVTSGDTVSFQPKQQQQALVRDGRPALVSRRPNSLVMIRPADRLMKSGGRPVFVVAAYNLTKQPINFLVGNIGATQTASGQATQIQVLTYEQLVSEEKTRQVARAVLVGAAVGLNAYGAAHANHQTSFNSTVTSPSGRTYSVSGTVDDPYARAAARARVEAQNDAMIAGVIERGQANLTQLESSVVKDNTLLPGEWYGGQLHLAPLIDSGAAKTYQIALQVGSDRHEIEITQAPAR